MSISSSILKTLAYADVFDYPLTVREVADYLISNTEVTVGTIQRTLKILTDPSASPSAVSSGPNCSGQVSTDREYFFLKRRINLVELREKRKEWSKEKWEIARRTAKKLKVIPAIKMIGVTGALAMDNCKEGDDIDLLIITSRNSLWLTRLLIILLTPILKIDRRKPCQSDVKDKICFNLFLEENHLEIKPENLFLAHEICQIKPIFDRDNIYRKFLNENRWVNKYLPNAAGISKVKYPACQSLALAGRQKSKPKLKAKNLFLYLFNLIAFYLQHLYMKPKMTVERVNLHQAFFHPKDLSNKIQKEFERRIEDLLF